MPTYNVESESRLHFVSRRTDWAIFEEHFMQAFQATGIVGVSIEILPHTPTYVADNPNTADWFVSITGAVGLDIAYLTLTTTDGHVYVFSVQELIESQPDVAAARPDLRPDAPRSILPWLPPAVQVVLMNPRTLMVGSANMASWIGQLFEEETPHATFVDAGGML